MAGREHVDMSIAGVAAPMRAATPPAADGGRPGRERARLEQIKPSATLRASAGQGSPATPGAYSSTRESRTQEAIRMKDEQLRILTDQNSHLLETLDKLEEEANSIQQQKLAVEEENRTLRDRNFELQSKVRAADAACKQAQEASTEREQQVKTLTDQNAELLRLLEAEEAATSKLQSSNTQQHTELEALRSKYASLLTTAQQHEEIAARAAREGQLRAEELRLLRAEAEQLRSQNAELKRKAAVELETLQEQLRVRKEKQYQLLERMHTSEETKRQATDQVSALEEKVRQLHERGVELETQLQLESRARRSQEQANKQLSTDLQNERGHVRALQDKVAEMDRERVRLEAETKDSGEQLREMAEKVFQLLERLKLAELGKSKAMEAVKRKDVELGELKKKNQRLVRESTNEGKARVRAELDKKVLMDQVRALKSHNSQLAGRCKEEVKLKLKEHEERAAAEEKLKTLGARLSFLLNKVQAEEEMKVAQREEAKKLEAQLHALMEQQAQAGQQLSETDESNRIIAQAMRLKQEELETLQIKYNALQRQLQERDGEAAQDEAAAAAAGVAGSDPAPEEVRASGGRGRFFLDHKPSQGFVFLRAKRASSKQLLDRLDVNGLLKRAQMSNRFKEMVLEKLAQLLGLLAVEEEDRETMRQEAEAREEQVQFLANKITFLADRVRVEEDARRRILLRYISAVKAAAPDMVLTQDGRLTCDGTPGSVQLAESGVGDEEVHALAALLRGTANIAEVNLRGNDITDEGARALAAVLAGSCLVRQVDLRENRISDSGIRALAEALERCPRVRHVYVHAGGKIEALGTSHWAAAPGQSMRHLAPDAMDAGSDAAAAFGAGGSAGAPATGLRVETVCTVDVRDNDPMGDADGFDTGLAAPVPGLSATAPPGAMGRSGAASPTHPAGKRGAGSERAKASRGRARVPRSSASTGSRSPSRAPVPAATNGAAPSSAVTQQQQAQHNPRSDSARRQRRALRQKRHEEQRRILELEKGWAGRSGGLDVGSGARSRASARQHRSTSAGRSSSRSLSARRGREAAADGQHESDAEPWALQAGSAFYGNAAALPPIPRGGAGTVHVLRSASAPSGITAGAPTAGEGVGAGAGAGTASAAKLPRATGSRGSRRTNFSQRLAASPFLQSPAASLLRTPSAGAKRG